MRRSLLYSLAVVFAVLNVAHCAPTNSKQVVVGVEKAKATRWPSILSCFHRNDKPLKAEVVALSQLLELLTDPDSGRNPFPKEVRYGHPSELMKKCKVDKLIQKTQMEALEQRAARILPDWKLTGFRVKKLQDRISHIKGLTQADIQQLNNELFNASLESPNLTWLRKEMESDVSGGWQILSELFSLYLEKRARNPGMNLSEEMHRLFTENQDIVKKFLEMDSVERVESMQRWSKEPMTDFAVELWEALDESDHRMIRMKVTNGFQPELELDESCSKLPNSESPLCELLDETEQELIRLKLEYESKLELGSCSKHPNSPTDLSELLDEVEQELIRLNLENDSKSELKSSSDAA